MEKRGDRHVEVSHGNTSENSGVWKEKGRERAKESRGSFLRGVWQSVNRVLWGPTVFLGSVRVYVKSCIYEMLTL